MAGHADPERNGTQVSSRSSCIIPDDQDERTPLIKSTDSTQAAGPVDSSQDSSQDSSHQTSENPQEEETTVIAKQESTKRLVVIIGTAYVGVLLGAIDSTVIATLTASIASEFRSLSLLSWLATAYLISNAACQPISGRLTDIFGRGPGLIFSNVFFSAGNLICGFATSSSVMILGRVVAGIGGGGLMSISAFLASDMVPLRKRGLVQGVGNLCYGSGAMLGGVFGGLLNDRTKMGWRLAFLIQVPPALLSAVAVFFLVKVPPKQSDKTFLARIDFVGVFLIVTFLVLLLLGLNSGGNEVPWTHPLPLTTIPLSVVAFVGFLWWERTVKQPIIPVRLLMTRTVLSACLCNLFSTMVVISGLFYLPLYFQVRGYSTTQAGLLILPGPVGVAVGSVTAGYVMNRTGRYTKLGVCSLVTMLAGVILYTMLNDSTPVYVTCIGLFFVGSGYGSMLTLTLLACIASVEHAQQAVITSATYLARSLGSTIGLTVSSAVYQNVLKERLWSRFGDYPNAADEIRRIRDDLGELQHLPEGWYEGVLASYMDAFRAVFLTFAGMSVVALVCVSLMRQHTLHATLERT